MGGREGREDDVGRGIGSIARGLRRESGARGAAAHRRGRFPSRRRAARGSRRGSSGWTLRGWTARCPARGDRAGGTGCSRGASVRSSACPPPADPAAPASLGKMSAWAVPRTSVRSGADSDIGRATTVPWIRYDRRSRKKGGAGTADASGARRGGRTRGSGRRRPTGASSPTMSQLLPDITRNSTFVSCLSAAEARAWSPKAVLWRLPTVRRERAPRRREATRRGAGKVMRRAMSLSSSRVRSESCRCFPRAACAGVFCVVARIAEDIVCDAILGRSFRCQTVPTTRAARMVTFAWFRASDNRHNTK